MDELVEELVSEPAQESVPQNRGHFRPGDRRINREGRPKGSKAATSAENSEAVCARLTDRLMQFSLPGRELEWRLTNPIGFHLVNLPEDVQIVDFRFSAATGQVTIIIRSQQFSRIVRGTEIPEFKLAFHGLKWRRDCDWRPQT